MLIFPHFENCLGCQVPITIHIRRVKMTVDEVNSIMGKKFVILMEKKKGGGGWPEKFNLSGAESL